MKNLNFGEELDPEHDLIASVELADGRRVPALSFVRANLSALPADA